METLPPFPNNQIVATHTLFFAYCASTIAGFFALAQQEVIDSNLFVFSLAICCFSVTIISLIWEKKVERIIDDHDSDIKSAIAINKRLQDVYDLKQTYLEKKRKERGYHPNWLSNNYDTAVPHLISSLSYKASLGSFAIMVIQNTLALF